MVIRRAARYALLAVCVLLFRFRHGWRCNNALGGVFAPRKLLRIGLAGLLILCACTNPFYPVYLGNGGGRGDNSGGAGGSTPTIPLPLSAGLYLMNAEGTAWEPITHSSIDPTDTTWYLAQVIAYMNNHHSPRFYGMAVDRNLTVQGATLGNAHKLYIQSTIGQYAIAFSTVPRRFIVEGHATLVLQNIHFQGDSNNNNGALVQLSGEAELTMYTGSRIINNRNIDNPSRGGGVHISGNSTFTLDGGSLTGNEADNGGGVYIDGDSDFIMKAGSITGVNNGGTNLKGGGVYAANSSNHFEMSGGSISGHYLNASGEAYGGGVYIDGGGSSFAMSGNAVISGNHAQSSSATDLALGGGVYSEGTFTMSGNARIGQNHATTAGNYGYGGGVCVSSVATFTKIGNTVIFGSDAGINANTDGNGTVQSAAVYINMSKSKDITAGPGDNLDSAQDGSAGGWD